MNKWNAVVSLLMICLGLCGSARAENLVDIYNLSVVNDPQLSEVRNNLMATQELRVQSRAVLFPTIRATGDTTRNKLRSDGEFVSGVVTLPSRSTFNSHGYTLSLTQPLFEPALFFGLRQVTARQRQAQAQLGFAQQELMLRAADRYFSVLGAEDNLAFAKAETKAIGRQLEQAKQRFDVGLIAITDIHEAQARYDQAVAREIEASNLLQRSREALREITGQLHDELVPLGDDLPLITPDPADMDTWVATALAQNSDINASRAAVDVAEQEINIRKSGHLPTMNLQAKQIYASSNGSRLGSASTNEDTVLSLNVEVPIFQGGFVNSRTREAQHLLAQAGDRLEQVRRRLEQTTRVAYMDVLATISSVKALTQALVSSQSALDATELGFKVGTRTSVDVLDSQRELFRAQQELSRVRYNHILSQLQLKLSAGTLSPADLETVNGWLDQ